MKLLNKLFIAAAMVMVGSAYASDTLTVSGLNYGASERAWIGATSITHKEVFDDSYFGSLQIGSNTFNEPFMYCDDLIHPEGSTPVTYQVNTSTITSESGWIVDNLESVSNTSAMDAGIQLAIWDLNNPGFTANPSDSASLTAWHNVETLAAGKSASATLLTWVSGGHGQEQTLLIPLVTPEPGPFIGMGLGLVGFAAFRRRRQRA